MNYLFKERHLIHMIALFNGLTKKDLKVWNKKSVPLYLHVVLQNCKILYLCDHIPLLINASIILSNYVSR